MKQIEDEDLVYKGHWVRSAQQRLFQTLEKIRIVLVKMGGKTEYAGISSGYIFPTIHTGQMYVCKECGYQGSFIIEVDNPDEVRKIKEALHEYSEDIEKPMFNFPEKWRWFWKVILFIWVAIIILNTVISILLPGSLVN